MVYTNTLTATQKDKAIPIIINRDGNVCFFCKAEFREDVPGYQRVIDHANDKPNDNRVENLLLTHGKCNEDKKENIDYKIIALEALRNNVSSASESLGEGEKKRGWT